MVLHAAGSPLSVVAPSVFRVSVNPGQLFTAMALAQLSFIGGRVPLIIFAAFFFGLSFTVSSGLEEFVA